MTPERFSVLSTYEKWVYLSARMDDIQKMENMFSMRRRLNPHHHPDQAAEETRYFRAEQYAAWVAIKDLYAAYRDELANTLDSPKYAECKNIFECIFTEEVDDALSDILE